MHAQGALAAARRDVRRTLFDRDRLAHVRFAPHIFGDAKYVLR
jgi:hypothetical protein